MQGKYNMLITAQSGHRIIPKNTKQHFAPAPSKSNSNIINGSKNPPITHNKIINGRINIVKIKGTYKKNNKIKNFTKCKLIAIRILLFFVLKIYFLLKN